MDLTIIEDLQTACYDADSEESFMEDAITLINSVQVSDSIINGLEHYLYEIQGNIDWDDRDDYWDLIVSFLMEDADE